MFPPPGNAEEETHCSAGNVHYDDMVALVELRTRPALSTWTVLFPTSCTRKITQKEDRVLGNYTSLISDP